MVIRLSRPLAAAPAQIQQRLMEALDKINKLPLNPMIEQATSTLSESQRTMKNLQTTLDSMNKILASQSMQQLPTDMQSTLRELNRSMQGFQHGSAAYNKMVADMQRLDQVLRELQPVLKTLNEKSNALVFEAKDKKIQSRRGRNNEKVASDDCSTVAGRMQLRRN